MASENLLRPYGSMSPANWKGLLRSPEGLRTPSRCNQNAAPDAFGGDPGATEGGRTLAAAVQSTPLKPLVMPLPSIFITNMNLFYTSLIAMAPLKNSGNCSLVRVLEISSTIPQLQLPGILLWLLLV